MLKQRMHYGNFGAISSAYDLARRGVPAEVMSHIFSDVVNKQISVLDLGCGTGISTRQITEYLKDSVIIGCDKDKKMIDVAKRHNGKIKYLVASAEFLPFGNCEFDIVTAFSAFHWFTNQKALDEIKRVLKKGSKFYAINQNKDKEFWSGYRSIIQKFIKETLPNSKENYSPDLILADAGFDGVKKTVFPCSHFYNEKDALEYIHSVSVWNYVIEENKEDCVDEELVKFISSISNNDLVEIKMDIVVVEGNKS